MGKYLKLFSTHQEYESFIQTDEFVKPNVSYCEDQTDVVHYNPIPHDYSKDYLTFVAREDGTISFNIWKSMGTDMITSISYSTDNGETWTTTANQNNKEEHLSIDVDVNEGDKVMWKGIATQTGYLDEEDYGDYVGSFFSSTCEFDAQGNVMSLLYGDDFKGETTIEEDFTFCYLFNDYDDNEECKLVNAENFVLPATTLANGCYYHMFYGCTSLTSAPELPATTLANYCYWYMFNGCTSLTSAPELLATTLSERCYEGMFARCESLTTAPELPATTLAQSCYDSMFNGCTSLNYIKAMFTTTPSTTYTDSWVSGVASSGTFVKNSAATWDVSGANGIPTGWTVETASK